MNPSAVTPEGALRLIPSIALDVFVFEYVLGGLLDPSQYGAGGAIQIPSFSRKWADSHLLMIKLMAENREDCLEVQLGDEFYESAERCGQVFAAHPVPVWKLSLTKSGQSGYGRKFEEALCKLSILVETKRRREMAP